MRTVEKAIKFKLLRESEIRDDARRGRENFIMEKAREMLNRLGFQALNLPELARLSGYSKPTIYKYFPNKEDLMVALAIESAAKQIAYFERAITFDGRPREKIHGLYSLNTGILLETTRDLLLIHSDKIRSKATAARQKMLDYYEERRIEIIAEIVRDAIGNRDLKLPFGVNEYQLIFTLMSTSLGGYVILESDSPVKERWFKKLQFTHGDFGRIVLDGMGWQPLSTEWDYKETINRFSREVFPELAEDNKVLKKAIG